MHALMHAWIHACMHACMQAWIQAWTQAWIHEGGLEEENPQARMGFGVSLVPEMQTLAGRKKKIEAQGVRGSWRSGGGDV